MCKLLHVFSFYSPLPTMVYPSQVLWSEAQPNNSSTAARRGALGIPVLFAARHLDSYTTRSRTARQRTARALCTSGRLRLGDTHRILAWRKCRAFTRERRFGRSCPRGRCSSRTEVGRLLEHVTVAVSSLPVIANPLTSSNCC